MASGASSGFDAHAHVNGPAAVAAGGEGMLEVVVGTRPSDWEQLLALPEDPRRRISLGVHPWAAQECEAAWLGQLEEALCARKGLGVGEIGLDAAWRPRGGDAPAACTGRQHGCRCKSCVRARQEYLFEAQLALAARLERATSVHCVRGHGKLASLLLNPETALPPRVNLHSWSGSAESTLQLHRGLAARNVQLFFGVSVQVNCRALGRLSLDTDCQDDEVWRPCEPLSALPESAAPALWRRPSDGSVAAAPWQQAPGWAKFSSRVQAVQPERLLLESDLHFGDGAARRWRAVRLAGVLCADALGMPLATVLAQAEANLIKFLG